MSNKQRRKNRKKKSKQGNSKSSGQSQVGIHPRSVLPGIENQNCPEQVSEPYAEMVKESPDAERFLLPPEIGKRLGGVGATCVRKWNREGKITLRKLFGTNGPWGMSETELVEFIRGGCKG